MFIIPCEAEDIYFQNVSKVYASHAWIGLNIFISPQLGNSYTTIHPLLDWFKSNIQIKKKD